MSDLTPDLERAGLRQVGWSWCPVLDYAVQDKYGHHGASAILCNGSPHTPLYTVDPAVLSALLQRHEAMRDALELVVRECHLHTYGKPGYDMTLDHLHEEALAALDREGT